MIFNNVILRVTDAENLEEIKQLLAHQASVSRQETGCERFEVYQSEVETNLFFLIEQWATTEDLDAHQNTDNFINVYKAKVLPKVERQAHPSSPIS